MTTLFEKRFEREYSLNRMTHLALFLLSPYAQKKMGFFVDKTLGLQLKNGNSGFFSDSQQWKKHQAFIRAIATQPRRFSYYYHSYVAQKQVFISTARRFNRLLLHGGNYSGTQLSHMLREFRNANEAFGLVGQWWGFELAEMAPQIVGELARKYFHDTHETAAFVSTVLTPSQISKTRQQHIDLLMLALVKNRRQREDLLTHHTAKYQWIPNINIFQPAPWTREHFARELQRIQRAGTAKRELGILRQRGVLEKKAFRAALLNVPLRDRQRIRNLHMIAFLKDDRDDTRRFAHFLVRPLYFAITKAVGLTPHELTLHTDEEIFQLLETGQRLSKKELELRGKGFAVVVKERKIKILVGLPYKKLLKRYTSKDQQNATIKGIPAHQGRVRGRVCIIPSAFHLRKMRAGDVLVTAATHPDYLPAMRKACAIVTSEGGLTSHAAIVARELGVPCIVGVKGAVDFLVDGDRVEVDAIKGVVRKI